MMMTYCKNKKIVYNTTTAFAAVAFVLSSSSSSLVVQVQAQTTPEVIDEATGMAAEELGLSPECSAALDNLITNTEVTGAHEMFFTDLLGACNKPDDMACTFDVSMVTGANIKMNACNMPQLDEYKTKCEAAGYTFCNMSADIGGTIELEMLGLSAPVSIEPSCIPMCMPSECNPDELEQMSPFQFSLDFAMDKIEEAVDDLVDIDIDITNTSVNMTFDCLEPGTMVEEKGAR